MNKRILQQNIVIFTNTNNVTKTECTSIFVKAYKIIKSQSKYEFGNFVVDLINYIYKVFFYIRKLDGSTKEIAMQDL